MRIIHPFRFLFVLIVLSAAIYSCNRGDGTFGEPCINVICHNGQYTNEGATCVCNCTPGYKGALCDTLRAAYFLGNYTCSSQSCTTSGFSSLVIHVTSNAYSLAKLDISNLHQAGGTTIADIDSLDHSFTIPAQPLSGSTVSGSAILNGNTLTVTYIMANGSTADTCTGVFVRQ